MAKAQSECIYSVLLDSKATVKDQSVFNEKYDIDPSEWKYLYMLPRSVLIDERSRQFQYKILQNYLSTNVQLNKMKIRDNELCSFCKQVPETMEHLLATCSEVRQFWTSVREWWFRIKQDMVMFTPSIIMFGHEARNMSHKNKLLNQVIIIAKQYIYWCRIKNKKLSINEYTRRIEYTSAIEKLCAKTERAKCTFNLKWKNVIPGIALYAED